MITKKALFTILELAKGYPFIAITGPRQSGKTTLSRAAFPENLDEFLYKGSYPPLYDRQLSPSQWHAGYVTTYL